MKKGSSLPSVCDVLYDESGCHAVMTSLGLGQSVGSLDG